MSTRENAQAAVDALKETGGNVSAAARLLKISRTSFRDRLDRASGYGLDNEAPAPTPPGEIVKGRSTLFSYDAEGDPTKILEWVKTREDPNFDHLLEAITEAFDEYSGFSVLPPPPVYTNSDLLALYPLADFHLGLYAWGEEAGQDWDVDKACACLRAVLAELVSTTAPAETAIVLNLGDFFHSDSSQAETTKGTRVDMDTRHARVLSFGVELMVEVIELALQRHGKVVLRNLRGNHDEHTSVALTAAMGAWFRNNDRVTVDPSPAPHWSYKFGKVLLGATHGDTLKKPETMALLLAQSCKEAWGQTDYRYFHYGHKHHIEMREVGGVLTECHRTLSAKDAWHAGAAYMSGRSMSSITYHRDHGEQSRRVVNIPHWRE